MLYYRIKFHRFLLVCLMPIIMSACLKVKPVTTPWDLLRTKPEAQQKLRVGPADCGLHSPYPLDHGFEMWYLDVLCPDGRMLLIYFKIGCIYRGLSPKAEVSINIYEPGKPYLIKKVTTHDFNAAADQCFVRIGESQLSGQFPDYQLQLHIEDIHLHLKIRGLIRGYKLTDNKVYFGQGENRYFNEWVVVLPRGYAQGELVVNQQKITLSGDVYLDHWLGNTPLNTVYSQCHWGKVFSERYTMIFLYARAEKRYGYAPLGFFKLFDGDTLLAATDMISLEEIISDRSRVTNRPYPTRFTIHVAAPEITGHIYCSLSTVLAEIHHVKDALGTLSPFFYPLARIFFGAPYSYGLLSQTRARLDIQGTAVSFVGPMFHEIDNKKLIPNH